MEIKLEPGTYVIAVSGGVDSAALLHLLGGQPDLKLTVAHFDHGIRGNSIEDRHFVQQLAQNYGLPFVYDEGHLGAGASEAEAREARYGFLRQVRQASNAKALITAHHQDDLLETAILNMLRGTGRKGLTSLQSRPDTLRPLLKVSKRDLIAYAKDQGLKWREDATNQDLGYSRNYVRHKLLPRFNYSDRAKLVDILTNLEATNQEVDSRLADLLAIHGGQQIDRQWFNQLPHDLAKEVMAAWLRANDLRGFDSKTLERLVIAAKTAAAGKVFPVQSGLDLQVEAGYLALGRPERWAKRMSRVIIGRNG